MRIQKPTIIDFTSATHTHADNTNGGTLSGYVSTSNANWTDLTDGGATTLHSHAGGGSPSNYTCTVGIGGDYATVGDALTAGMVRILLISSVTETGNWNSYPRLLEGKGAFTITMGTYYIVPMVFSSDWKRITFSTSLTTGSFFSGGCYDLNLTNISFTGGAGSGTAYYFGDAGIRLTCKNVSFGSPRYGFTNQTTAKDNNIVIEGGDYSNGAVAIGIPFQFNHSYNTANDGYFFKNFAISSNVSSSVFKITSSSTDSYPMFLFEGGNIQQTASSKYIIFASNSNITFRDVGYILSDAGDLVYISGQSHVIFDNCGIQVSNILNNDTNAYSDVTLLNCTTHGSATLGVCRTTTTYEPKVTIINLKLASTNLNTGVAGYYDRRWIMAYNDSGIALGRGDLVDILWSTTYQFKVAKSAALEDTKLKGIVMNGVNNSANVPILIQGYCYKIKVDGTTNIAAGDYLSSSATAGISVKNATANKAYAQANAAYTTDDANGVIAGVLFGQLR